MCGTKVRENAAVISRTAQGPASAATSANDASSRRLSPESLPPAKQSGSKVLVVILLLVLLAVAGIIGGGVYVAYRVKQKATVALDKLESGDSADHKGSSDDVRPNDSGNNSGDSNSTKNTDQSNPQDGKQPDGDDTKVAKGLDAIGGLMDKMGLGDPPPNPYQELPVVTADDLHRNFCDRH